MNTTTYLGTCGNCDRTFKFNGSVARFVDCPNCAVNPTRIAEREAWMAEHPAGHFPMGTVVVKAIRAKLGRKVCDEACTSARKESCTCQCGGRNHGGDYAAAS